MRRVVITGMGVVSPLGGGLAANWETLVAGGHGFRRITDFEVSDLPCQVAGMVPLTDGWGKGNPNAVDLGAWIEPKMRRKIDTFGMYGSVAAQMAIEDSGWQAESEEDRCRTGVLMGSGVGGLNSIYDASLTLNERGPKQISPFFLPFALINMVSGQISIKNGFKGPNSAPVTACSTGTHAIGDASRLIKYGNADVMVAGGTEASVGRLGIAGFAALRALSTNFNDTPEKASRPWDKDRDGFVMGEGAGALILEEYEHAKARGARIYAEVKGYGLSGDAYHITAPAEDGDGGFRGMQEALKDAELAAEDIDYINAHGTSTPLGDVIEIAAIKRLFGSALENGISISSTKSATGHLLGAAGAVEAIYSVLAIQHNMVPPTRNLDNPADEVKGLDLVPFEAKEREVRYAMSNSFGFGGTNAILIFGQV